MKKIISATFVPGTMHPAVGSDIKIVFDDGSDIVTKQDTLLGLYDTDLEADLIGKEWLGKQ